MALKRYDIVISFILNYVDTNLRYFTYGQLIFSLDRFMAKMIREDIIRYH